MDEAAIQSAHSGFVPRVGGLSIYISLLGLIPLLSFGFIPLSLVFDLNADELIWLILSAAPVFLVGLAEDLGYAMAPKFRILASVVSSLLAIFLFEVWLSKVGVPGLDSLLSFAPVAILFTIFATVGVVNAFNLVDGLNGLSSYTAISSALSLSIIAFQVSDVICNFSCFINFVNMWVFDFKFPFWKNISRRWGRLCSRASFGMVCNIAGKSSNRNQ